MNNIEKLEGWGYVIVDAASEVAIPDTQTQVDLERRFIEKVDPETLDLLILELDFEVELPVISCKRVRGVFARLDMGGYWSPYSWGETFEEVMEQLDDLYGVYEDYL